MGTRELRKDWLASNAVTVFVAALLIAQHWSRTYNGYDLRFIDYTIPNFEDSVVFAIGASLVVSSIILVAASVCALLRQSVFRTTALLSALLWTLILVAFLFSWIQALQGIPSDQWWSQVPVWLGIGFLFFIAYRILDATSIVSRIGSPLMSKGRKVSRCSPKVNAISADSNDDQKRVKVHGTQILARIRASFGRGQIPESGAFWIVASVVVATIEVVLAVFFWGWLSGGESGSTTIRNIGIIVAGTVALLLAVWRALVADRQARAAQDQSATVQQSLVNERYQKGAEMLGSAVLSVRLGGIYALRRLVEEHPKQYYVQVTRLFCAFVRFPTGDPNLELGRAPIRPGSLLGIRQDVESVMETIGSRAWTRIDPQRRAHLGMDLRGADLSESQILHADLSGAMLQHSNLSQVNFADVDLSYTSLSGADLSKAQFRDVDFTGTSLWSADMSGVMLQGAEMPRMSFDYTNLCGANLEAANLSGAIFQDAKVSNAWFGSADLTAATFIRVDLSRARLDSADLAGAEFLNVNMSGANLSEANLSGAQFTRGGPQTAEGLTQSQLDQACADPDNPPKLLGVLDADTGGQLVWRGKPLSARA